jgi:hypothetical protein
MAPGWKHVNGLDSRSSFSDAALEYTTTLQWVRLPVGLQRNGDWKPTRDRQRSLLAHELRSNKPTLPCFFSRRHFHPLPVSRRKLIPAMHSSVRHRTSVTRPSQSCNNGCGKWDTDIGHNHGFTRWGRHSSTPIAEIRTWTPQIWTFEAMIRLRFQPLVTWSS